MICSTQRRNEILNLANEHGKVLVIELARRYAISEVTIRHDLNTLDKMGLLTRSRGGALAGTGLSKELSIGQKQTKHQRIKQRLAQQAAKLINNGDAIILDSGTTTEEIAMCLLDHQPLTVMTNGLNVAAKLAQNHAIEVLVTGGTLRQKSLSFFDPRAQDSLRHYHFDKVILGVDGFDLEAGITTHFEQEASLNRLMCASSSQIIAVTDSSKFDQRSCHIICQYQDIHTLITDSGIPQHYVDALTRAGVELCIVDQT